MAKDKPLSVMPIINVDSVDEALRFYSEKLGFERVMGVVGKDGAFDFVTVVRSGVRIMFGRAPEPMAGTAPTRDRKPVEIYVEVEDVQRFHDDVRRAGIEITTPLTTQWWGDRTFTIQDPYGYTLWFYQPVAEPNPPAGMKIV
jgi:PhnB protein